MLTSEQLAFLSLAASAAVVSEKATRLPAELTLAQGIFESGWGRRMPGNNAFGIKPDHHGAGVQYFLSREYMNGAWQQTQEAFEKYDTLADCFIDHARLLTQGAPYALAWQRFLSDGDVDGLAQRVAAIYATDPNYAGKILEEMNSATVTNAIAVARSTS